MAMTKADMAQISIIILAMKSVYFDGFVLDGDVDLLEVIEAFNDFVEGLCLIPAEVKAK